jgi:hypothetical protein
MGRQPWFRMAGALCALSLIVVPANAEAEEEDAEEEEEEESGDGATGLGPFELSPEPLGGNLGAPRSAVPETRLGVGLHWVMGGESTSAGDVSRHHLALFAQGQLELFEVLEVGLEAELLQFAKVDFPDPSPVPDTETSEFGFLVPRIKVAFLTGDVITLGAGLGVMLPTATGRDGVTPIGFDPGFYFQAQLFDLLSINFSLPFVLRFDIPDEGDVTQNYFIDPTVGVTVMPIDYIGGFVDAQLELWLNPDEGAENFRLFNLLVGLRSNFLPWMMAELGAIIPVAGDVYDELADFGLGFRIAATPDFL